VFTKLAKHDDDEGEGDEGEAVGFEFFIAGGNSAELFDLQSVYGVLSVNQG
jgi:hypothetical protein